jgi:uncharacterized protein
MGQRSRFGRPIRHLVDDIVGSTFRTTESESAQWIAEHPGVPDRQAIVVGVTAAVALLAKHVAGDLAEVNSLLERIGPDRLSDWFSTTIAKGDSGGLPVLSWWVGSVLVWYLAFPALVGRFVLGQRMAEFGWRRAPWRREGALFLLVTVVAIPVVIAVSASSRFQDVYPFLDIEPGSSFWRRLLIWELLYFAQFVAVEFFFRGFIVLGMRRRLGYYSVFVMVIPYCMIHFQKPSLEAAGAIVAGLFLGTLSLRSRSIWLGALLHCTVALTMDMSSLWRAGAW